MKKRNLLAAVLSLSLTVGMIAPVNLAQENKKERKTAESVEDSVGEVSKYGYLPIQRKVLNSNDLSSGRKKMTLKTKIPSAFDAREEGLLTDVKDQGDTGLCWAVSAIGASEASVLKNGYEKSPDLSEYHLGYSAYNKVDDPLGLTTGDIMKPKTKSNSLYEMGGNSIIAAATLARWQGTVDESVASFDDLKNKINEGVYAQLPDDVMYEKDSYHLQNVEYIYMTEDNRDEIKQKLMEYGAAECSIYAPESRSDFEKYGNTGKSDFTAYYCNNASLPTNHSVLIVGWDDDYSADNFNSQCRPSSDGAWLIRNSWGDDCNSMGGYFWISYEDAMLQEEINEGAEAAFFEVAPVGKYENNYQYDGGIPLGYSDGFVRGANVFQAVTDEKMQAVSFYTQEENVSYEISVYENPNSENPMSGTLLSTFQGTSAERGYHTIDFAEAGQEVLFMGKGKRYSIVVKLTRSDGESSYQTYEDEIKYQTITEAVSAGKGESYVQYSDGEWEDFFGLQWLNGRKNHANLCIKMFSSEWDSKEPTPTPVPTSTPLETVTPTQTPLETVTPMQTPLVTVTPLPTQNTTSQPTVTDNPVKPDNGSAQTVVVKKMRFKYSSKKVKAGKKVKLSKWLKVTKNRAGDAKITYKFTKSKYKKYATLSKKGVFKAKKAGKKKTVYVKAAAGDGSKKTAKIKIKIK